VEEKTPMTGKGRSERKVPENQPALLTSGLTELCSIHPDPDVSRTVPWDMGSRGRETMMTALMSRGRVVIWETWKRERVIRILEFARSTGDTDESELFEV
jgi:hypothetical protein